MLSREQVLRMVAERIKNPPTTDDSDELYMRALRCGVNDHEEDVEIWRESVAEGLEVLSDLIIDWIRDIEQEEMAK